MHNEGTAFLSRTKDVFLAEPITVDGRYALLNTGFSMTENELFNDVFVMPFSEHMKKRPETVTDDDEPDTPEYFDIIDMNSLKLEENQFIKALRSLSKSFFIIKGVAGTGKTTYTHYLKRMLGRTIKFRVHDFEEVVQSVPFLCDSIDLGTQHYTSNVYKFMATIYKFAPKALTRCNYICYNYGK